MKTLKSIIAGLALAGAALCATSCNDILNLSPVDYYGSGNFWKTEAQVDGYICTLNSYLRDQCFNHTIMFGELRGGLYKTSSGSSDGSTHLNGDVMLQNFDADHTGVSKFGNYYGAISQTNLFITRVEAITFLPEAKKKHYLGIAYGIRAFLYFDLYRTYGAVPLRLDVKVVDGETDPTKLYLERSSPDKVIKQIKDDIDTSLKNFENADFDPYGYGMKVVWSKAATEYLAGEVYLWNAKVDVSDINGTHKAEPADIDKAKTYFENVVHNYGLSLQDNFTDVFDVSNKGNSEIIFAIRYLEDESGHAFASSYTYMSDGRGTLSTQVNADGTTFGDPMKLNGAGGQWYEYTNEFYESFDKNDTRKSATFVPCYSKVEYDKGNLVLLSAPVRKNIGHVNASNVHVWDGDQPYYRLAGAYLALAEIANYKGVKADIENNINEVRARAYGDNWDETLYGYKASDNFEENEIAILCEKDKEFVQEGQRWYDLCRMTSKKDGAVTDHLAFNSKVPASGAVLKTSEAYKLLWPLDKTILGNDPKLKQTVGYK